MSAFSHSARLALELCLAQWLGSPQCTAMAYAQGLARGIPAQELERNRRARSDDADLQRMLRYAITIVIARGRVTERERACIADVVPEAAAPELASLIICLTYRCYLYGLLTLGSDAPVIDMSVGDY